MLEILEHTLLDTVMLIPFLFITYIIMEAIEHHAADKTEKIIKKSGRFGPIIGSLLGVIPQCGFSAVASNFYAARMITMGTLISIFLSTSDEMLPVLISEGANLGLIVQILLIKVIIGMGVGIVIDLLMRSNKSKENLDSIHKICEDEHCHCENEGIIKSSIKHTLQIYIYIFVISLIINGLIHYIGEDKIANLIVNTPIFGTLVASLIGLTPNCASSIILTELYLENIITLRTNDCRVTCKFRTWNIGFIQNKQEQIRKFKNTWNTIFSWNYSRFSNQFIHEIEGIYNEKNIFCFNIFWNNVRTDNKI